ncbi:hypothetical protein FRB97_005903 [Tulasnella sp. 331]|nr:hypothetical protein FRB97_005903 [Tulasnella sp. 331]
MSDTAVPPPTTSTIQPAVDPATSSEPVAVTSEPVDKPAMATDTNVARTASDGEGGRSPTGTKRKSALGGFFADLKKALPKSNKQQQQGQGQATSDAATPTATAHPGTIISDQSHTKGAQPVVPRDPTRKAHRGLLTGVDAIVSKEAERIMNSMSGMVENSGNNQSNGDIPLNIRDTMYPPESETHEHELPQHKQKWMSNWETATIDKACCYVYPRTSVQLHV